MSSGQRPLLLVQVLRALAATLVLLGHTNSEVNRVAMQSGAGSTLVPHIPTGFGVDLFFVISGFIMVMSSQRLFGTRHGSGTFLMRRFTRLVPLYWIVTLVYVAVLVAGSHGYHGDLLKALLTSLSFVPYPTYGVDGSGNVYPLYTLGWTLNYEMFFYVIFAIFIGLSQARAVRAIGATLALLVAIGLLLGAGGSELTFWTQPIILEFGFGLGVGTLWLSDFRLSAPTCLLIAVAALCVVVADPGHLTIKLAGGSTPNDLRRVLAWGLPAAAILLAVTLLEKSRPFHGKFVSALSFGGDCSYALYLIHPLVLESLLKLWEHLKLAKTLGFVPLGVAVLVVSYAAAALTHLLLERPLTRKLQSTTPLRLYGPGAPSVFPTSRR